MMRCWFCDGDTDDPGHAARCDGRQGQVEAAEDLPLFARASDPETSRDAMAAYDREAMRSAMTCVVALLRERGRMADYELRAAFPAAWGKPCDDSLYRQARNQARNKGLIFDTTERRRNPTTNRQQVVWAFRVGDPPAIHRCPSCGGIVRRTETEL